MLRNEFFHHKSLKISEDLVVDTIEELRQLLNHLKKSFGQNVNDIKDQLSQVPEHTSIIALSRCHGSAVK